MSVPPRTAVAASSFCPRALCDWPLRYQLTVAARIAAGQNTVLTIAGQDGVSRLFGVYIPPWRDELSRTLTEMALGLRPLKK